MHPAALNALAWLAPARFRRGAGAAFATPSRRPPIRPEHAAWLAEAERIGFDGPQGLQIAHARGRGPTALLQHGWEGAASDLVPIAHALVADGWRVVLVDGPAHGASAGRRATLDDFAAGLAEAGRRAGAVDAVVAHSMGVPAAVLALADHGLDAGALVGLAGPDTLRGSVEAQARAMGLGARATRLLLEAVEHRMRAPLDRYDVARDAPRFGIPALLLHGAEDRIVPPACSARVGRAWPGARVHVIPGVGHRRILDAPGVADLVVDAVGAGPRHRAARSTR